MDEDRNPIPFATIIFNNGSSGTYSNEEGSFLIHYNDTLVIRHLGFKEKMVFPEDTRDTIFLTTKEHILNSITIYPTKSYTRTKHKFNKKNKLDLSFPSLEVGVIVPSHNGIIENVEIPFKASKKGSLIRMKLYSVSRGLPNGLLYSEVIQIKSSDKNKYLSFNDNLIDHTIDLDSIFVSIELIQTNVEHSFGKSNDAALSIFFELYSDDINTYGTRNYDLMNKWARFDKWDDEERVPNLIYFPITILK
jgi:hypothetical protein